MVKHLQKVGNSHGIILDKPILDLLNADEHTSFEIVPQGKGLLLMPVSVADAYAKVAKKHRKSLDKLGR